jgi:hypothetical protein
MRYTEPNITRLEPNEIFVFGSNEGGKHGKGAALTAKRYFGAIQYQPEGLMGQSYALPTVDEEIRNKLPLDQIKRYIGNFIECAKAHPELTFLVTEIGCGLAGWKVGYIAPLFNNFKPLPDNIVLPYSFHLKPEFQEK